MERRTSPPLRAATALLFAACLLRTLDAHAAPGELFKMNTDDYMASSGYYGPGGLFSASYSSKSTPGFYHNGYRNGSSSHDVDSHFQAGVTLFNKTAYLVSVFAIAEREAYPGQTPKHYAHGRVFVGSDLLYYVNDYDENRDNVAAAAFQRGLTQTFFSQTYATSVGPIPVTVHGSVKGSATGGTNAESKSLWLTAETKNGLHGQAGVHGTFRLTVGIPSVLAAGVEGYCNFITATLTPNAFSNSAVEVVAGKPVIGYRWGHAGPMTLSTLDGWVNLFVDVPFYTYEKGLLSWRGASWSRDLWRSSKHEQYSFDW